MTQAHADDSVPIGLLLDRARELVAMVQGRTRRDLSTDRLFQLAVTRLIGVIGEMTRVGVHGYDRDPDWDLATLEVPKVIAALEHAAARHQG